MPTSSGCCKNYVRHLENALEMENAVIPSEEKTFHSFGYLFPFFLLDSSPNEQVSENYGHSSGLKREGGVKNTTHFLK